ncbi:hypothetical protein GYMLUDRAFT_243180 [Collybiopsis luxurians FD-317 M1]|uniref:Uncharacterized protein n=1 Tax=Collybiopsis luxurians FD-317 M1 TaxID=944289 RepID=A0A0D0CHC9_9AGAR|nr:hypothetical protein GYMLUDRAFT_243180 [Collybiopsis luxurians FD-317 M1]
MGDSGLFQFDTRSSLHSTNASNSERFGYLTHLHSPLTRQLSLQGNRVDIPAVPEGSSANHVNPPVQSTMLYVPEACIEYSLANLNGTGQYHNGPRSHWLGNALLPDINLPQMNIDPYSQASHRAEPRPYYPPAYQSPIHDMPTRMNMFTQVPGYAQPPPAYFHLPTFDDREHYLPYDPPQSRVDISLPLKASDYDCRADHGYQGTTGFSWPPPGMLTGRPQPSPALHARGEYPTRSRKISSSICRFLKGDGTECGVSINKDNVDSHIYGHLPKARNKNEKIPQTLCWWKLETGKQCGQLCKDAKVLFRHVHTHHKIKVVCPYPPCEEHLSRGRHDVILDHLERVHGLPKHPKRKSERHLNGDRFSSGYPKKEVLTWGDIRDLYGGNSDEWREIEMKVQEELSAD